MTTTTRNRGVRRPTGVLPRVTCPHCWEQCAPEDLLWVSEHAELYGDERLGTDQPRRFLPTRFNLDGLALDARGLACHQLACPNCHLLVPRALLEMEPLFVSIFGSQNSGKSYYLAALSWELRRQLPLKFQVSFADADPSMNRVLRDYEESVFANGTGETPVPLGRLIHKTQVQGDMYDTVAFGSQTVTYPHPFLLSMRPLDQHPNAERAAELGKVVCLYDNAGESFQPGADSATSPVTRHMARSRVLLFVCDPLQEARFRAACAHPAARPTGTRLVRQEPILQEAAARIRKYAQLTQTEKHAAPLVVVLTKFDLWSTMLNDDRPAEPFQTASLNGSASMHAVNAGAVDQRSLQTRGLLMQHCPELVVAAEGFAQHVLYVPVSALGWNVSSSAEVAMIRPADAQPYWVTVPILYALSKHVKGLIPRTV